MKKIILILLVVLMTGCTMNETNEKTNNTKKESIVKDKKEALELKKSSLETIEFKELGEDTLSMNIYSPITKVYEKSPVVIYVHEGGWTKGDKSSVTDGERNTIVNSLIEKGYTVISPDYRMMDGETVFPSNLEDIHDCFEFIRSNSHEYEWDENNIGIWGTGAGAQLALIEAYSNDLDYVIDYYGATNFMTLLKHDRDLVSERLKMLTGVKPSILNRKQIQETLKTASPISYVNEESVPTLIVHGINDSIVPVDQGRQLYEKLSGTEHQLLLVESDEHGLLTSDDIKEEIQADIVNQTVEFILEQYNQ